MSQQERDDLAASSELPSPQSPDVPDPFPNVSDFSDAAGDGEGLHEYRKYSMI